MENDNEAHLRQFRRTREPFLVHCSRQAGGLLTAPKVLRLADLLFTALTAHVPGNEKHHIHPEPVEGLINHSISPYAFSHVNGSDAIRKALAQDQM